MRNRLRRSSDSRVSSMSPSQNPNPNQTPKSSVPESVTHLRSLNGALSDFILHYDALQQTLDSINSSLDEAQIEAADELKSICRSQNYKALRRHISAHLHEVDRLRREFPEALKLAHNPARFIFDAKGGFYMQPRSAYDRGDANTVNSRRVGILLMEFYVLAGCPVGENCHRSLAKVKEGASNAAVSWRSRLISEGGLEAASPVDALGLVLLVASFGIPQEFREKDMCTLLRLSNLRKKRDVLRRSPILVQELPDIIKVLIAKGMHVEAIDLVCAFGLEEKFPPLLLLSSFVKEACECEVEERREGQCSLKSLKEANEKQLAALNSVVKCLKDHKLDATKLASLKIDQKIAKCEKEILNGELKLHDEHVKRKFEDVFFFNLNSSGLLLLKHRMVHFRNQLDKLKGGEPLLLMTPDILTMAILQIRCLFPLKHLMDW